MSPDFDQKKVWVQRDGTPIRVKDMGTSHLENTLALLKRHADAIQLVELGRVWSAPDDVFDMALRDFAEDGWTRLKRTPLVKAMRKELKRRKLCAAVGCLDGHD